MQTQNSNRIIPKVRYHPTIQTPGDTEQAKTRTRRPTTNIQTQNSDRIIPKVWYHPTIQMPGDTGQAKTRTRPTQKARPAPVPSPENPQENVDPSVRPRPVSKKNQKPDPRAAPDPDPPQDSDLVPLDPDVHMDRSEVQRVEVLTRGQRENPDWFKWRRNLITASVAHRIAHCRFVHGKSQTPPKSYLDAITGEGRRVQTRAMSWGIEKEAEVVRKYQRMKSAALGRRVSVQDCGLFIDPERSWLAASPDGIVMDDRTDERLLCLEVKCPYKHRHHRVEDACREDSAFCLELQDEDGRQPGESAPYRLKTSHSYYTQIQVQLAVTGLERADLVVFTPKETAIVPVTFDPDLWEETVTNLEFFYRNAVLPHLRGKSAAAVAARRLEP